LNFPRVFSLTPPGSRFQQEFREGFEGGGFALKGLRAAKALPVRSAATRLDFSRPMMEG